ncbi:hypothetical protein DGG96_09370 [Legionella qingyii]|uniref:Uncharacterized protein n=1 Tax=Legionella qingyii TaxID=2184757 RepID=A0A317U1M4_9GAMM|nr:hypothetical protein DGG96_09370 [Legionella qingyii]
MNLVYSRIDISVKVLLEIHLKQKQANDYDNIVFDFRLMRKVVIGTVKTVCMTDKKESKETVILS